MSVWMKLPASSGCFLQKDRSQSRSNEDVVFSEPMILVGPKSQQGRGQLRAYRMPRKRMAAMGSRQELA